MREPCIVRWPGQVPAGAECREVATIMDLLPTFARLAGTEAPKDRIIDGKDIWPLLAGEAGAKSPYDAFFYHTAQGQLAAVRQGKWKLHVVAPGGRPQTKGAPQEKAPLLFDLLTDIGETKNVAGEHPDIVARLTDIFRRFDADLQAHLRPPGSV